MARSMQMLSVRKSSMPENVFPMFASPTEPPLHASAYDAQNVVVRVVKSKKSRSTPRVGWQRFLDDETKYVFEHC